MNNNERTDAEKENARLREEKIFVLATACRTDINDGLKLQWIITALSPQKDGGE